MKKLFFLTGLLLGWLLSAAIPVPLWLDSQIFNIIHAGQTRVARQVREGAQALQKKAIAEKVNALTRGQGEIEKGAAALEQKIESD